MNYLFLSAAILFSLNANAQTADSLPKKRLWQIGVSFSSDYSYRTLHNNSGDPSMENLIKLRNDLETPKFGYTTGINASYNFTRLIALEFGMHYSNKGYQMKDLLYTTVDHPEGEATGDVVYNFHYLDIPLRANLMFGKKKLQFIAGLGLTTNIYLKEIDKSIIHYSDRDEEYTFEPDYDYRTVQLSAALSTGIHYSFTDRMALRFEPIVRYSLTNIIDTPVTARFFNAGINVGYYLSF